MDKRIKIAVIPTSEKELGKTMDFFRDTPWHGMIELRNELNKRNVDFR